MSELDYQNRDESGREEQERRHMRWFGPSQSKIWETMAHEAGLRFVPGSKKLEDRIIADVGSWQITLNDRSRSEQYPVIRAPFVNAKGFRFAAYPISVSGVISTALGAQDVKVGYPDLDYQLIVKANDEELVRQLFASERFRELLRRHVLVELSAGLRVRRAQKWGGVRFGKDVDEVYYELPMGLKDAAWLKSIFELIEVTLQQLCSIGVAVGVTPGVERR